MQTSDCGKAATLSAVCLSGVAMLWPYAAQAPVVASDCATLSGRCYGAGQLCQGAAFYDAAP